jgi:hypothetical protein
MMTTINGLSRAGTAARLMQDVALEYLREKQSKGEIPTSIRFVFYELEQRGQISKVKRVIQPGKKSARTHGQDLTDAVTKLREIGLVPWTWIVDESRRVDDWSTPHATVMAAVASMAEHVRIDPWVGTSRPVMIAESRGVAGVIGRRFAYEYAFDVVPLGGNCRGFLETEVADRLRDPKTHVLYIGDADDCERDRGPHPTRTPYARPGASSTRRLGSGLRSRRSKWPISQTLKDGCGTACGSSTRSSRQSPGRPGDAKPKRSLRDLAPKASARPPWRH